MLAGVVCWFGRLFALIYWICSYELLAGSGLFDSVFVCFALFICYLWFMRICVCFIMYLICFWLLVCFGF